MTRIAWTAEAQNTLQDIYDYTAADNPQAAEDAIGGIYAHA